VAAREGAAAVTRVVDEAAWSATARLHPGYCIYPENVHARPEPSWHPIHRPPPWTRTTANTGSLAQYVEQRERGAFRPEPAPEPAAAEPKDPWWPWRRNR
jgi:hypothetical protein